MTMLTVVHVETGRHLYGGALQVYYLLRGLKQRGVRNILVCPTDSEIARAGQDATERVRAFPMSGDLDLRFIARLRGVLREVRPDLLHLHSRRGADVLGGIAGRLERVPTVLTRRVATPEPRWIAGIKYRMYDRIIAISQGIRDTLIESGIPGERIECVHSAVAYERYRASCDRGWFQNEFGLTPAHRPIGMVARFIECKGHHHLIAAMPAIVEAVPEARFLLFGRGPLEEPLRERVRRAGLEEHVRFAGFRDDLERILPCLELLVHPAELEGLGVSLLQASAAGVPIVASAVGGIPDAVADGVNGILIASKDAPALTRSVIALLRDPERARALGAAGRARVAREFSIEAMVDGNLRVYQALVGERQGMA